MSKYSESLNMGLEGCVSLLLSVQEDFIRQGKEQDFVG